MLETSVDDGWTLRGHVGVAAPFAALADHAAFWTWPAALRPIAGTSRAALHAKVIAADEAWRS